ncbi:hypothetical protein FRC02_009474 [Tulasnella sp. 418]|nr:hypothetical protein FRC02_009474 [Tulasnella sp. 418]
MRFLSLVTVAVALAAPSLAIVLPRMDQELTSELLVAGNELQQEVALLPDSKKDLVYIETKNLVLMLATETKQDLDDSVNGEALFAEITRLVQEGNVDRLPSETREKIDAQMKKALETAENALNDENSGTEPLPNSTRLVAPINTLATPDNTLAAPYNAFADELTKEKNSLERILENKKFKEDLFELLDDMGIEFEKEEASNATADDVIAAVRKFASDIMQLSEREQEDVFEEIPESFNEWKKLLTKVAA